MSNTKKIVMSLTTGKMKVVHAKAAKPEAEKMEAAATTGKKIGKPAAGVKAAPKKAAKAVKTKGGTRQPKYEATAHIKILAKEPPYREGTKAAATWALILKSKTVGDYRTLVEKDPDAVDGSYIRYAARDGYISVG